MLHTKEIEYQAGGVNCRGFIAYQETISNKPCVLIAHDWSGRSQPFCDKAKEIAEMGMVGFAIDMYGDAKTGQSTEENQALLAPFTANRNLVAERILPAYKMVTTLPGIDSTKIAAIGYCFGGLTVLDLARIGADVKGVVSFHGLLTAPESTRCEKIRAKILVLHGYDDPMVPPAQVQQFASEMTLRKADWQVHMYGHTKHSFTNKNADNPSMGLKYSELANHRSWESTKLFFKELFPG